MTADPYKRHRTRYPGITYRVRAKGSRQYHVLHRGKWVAVEGGEAEAKALQGRYRERKGRGERVIVAKNLTVAAILDEWFGYAKQRKKRPLGLATIPEYERYIEFLKERYDGSKIGAIDAVELVELVQDLEGEGLSESGVANKMKPLLGALKYAATKGYIPRNPWLEVDGDFKRSCNTTREHRAWTTEEVERVIRIAHERDQRPEARCDYGTTIELLFCIGPRLGEALGARYGDIETEGRAAVLVLSRQWTKRGHIAPPKANSVGRIPLPWSLYQKIAARKLRLGAGEEDYISAHKKGANPPSHSNFRRRGWNPAIEEAGLDGPKATVHDSRHACASWLVSRGLKSEDVTAVLRHKRTSTTEGIYVHAFDPKEREERIRTAMESSMGGGGA